MNWETEEFWADLEEADSGQLVDQMALASKLLTSLSVQEQAELVASLCQPTGDGPTKWQETSKFWRDLAQVRPAASAAENGMELASAIVSGALSETKKAHDARTLQGVIRVDFRGGVSRSLVEMYLDGKWIDNT